jgi:LPS-assembly lipoprotein
MSPNALLRIALGMALMLSASGCGFKLRREGDWPQHWDAVQVEAPDRLSPLKLELERQLDVYLSKAEPKYQLVIVSEQLAREVLSVDARARVSEYLLRYMVSFKVLSDGSDVVPEQSIELSRDYRFDELQALGAVQEEALISEELRQQMVRRMLERISLQAAQAAGDRES